MIAFWAGFLTAGLIAVFLFFNSGAVTIRFWRWSFSDVNLGLVALVPLALGVATGYLYHLPARLHHVSEHMRHRRRVHELEKELKELRKGMDHVLEMPGDQQAVPALESRPVRALEAPRNGGEASAGETMQATLDQGMDLPHEPPAQERVIEHAASRVRRRRGESPQQPPL